MEKRDVYLESLKERLDEWNDRIDTLEVLGRLASQEVQRGVQEQLAHLRGKRDELQAKLKHIQTASEDAWEVVKEGVEKAQHELKIAFDEAKSRLTR